MAVPRSQRWSTVLLVAGGIALLLSGLVGFLNSTLVNGATFAQVLNEVRQDDAVKDQVGAAISAAAVDAQPDLIAIEPAITAGASVLVGSPLLDGVFTPAVRQFHDALTQQGGGTAVLTLADLGATATTALRQFVPAAADLIPEDLNLTLARIGGQEGVAAQIIPAINSIATLAVVLPLLTLVLFALGVWLAPRRRIALVRLGWVFLVVGGVLGLVVLALWMASVLLDDATLGGAVASAVLAEFSQRLAVRFVGIAVLGALMVAAAGALFPQVDVGAQVRRAAAVLMHRPTSPAWALARALGITGVGIFVVLSPTVSAQAVAVVAGLALVVVGIGELDRVAEDARALDEREAVVRAARDEQPERPSAVRWVIPVTAAVAGVLVLGALLLPDHLPQDQAVSSAAATDPDACNGSVELCDVPYDRVVVPASHNSMSVADGTWFLAEQPKDMVDSLDDGIRGLLVDTWYGLATENGRARTGDRSVASAEEALVAEYGQEVADSVRRTIDRVRRSPVTGPEVPFFCHTVCELGATEMLPVMTRLNTWLEEHPREVVTLFIQDTVTPQDTAAVLQEAGLADKAYTHPDGAPWPTLQEMIDSDRRLVVLMENQGGGAEYPWLHQGFDLVQDTEYTFSSAADFTCTLKRGSPDSPLFNVNHWLASFARLVSNAKEVNAYDVLRDRIDQCVRERGRIPSMVSVNWYDQGDLFRVVDELNGEVAAQFGAATS